MKEIYKETGNSYKIQGIIYTEYIDTTTNKIIYMQSV